MMNIMEKIFHIRSCIEILANESKSTQLISIHYCSTVNKDYTVGSWRFFIL